MSVPGLDPSLQNLCSPPPKCAPKGCIPMVRIFMITCSCRACGVKKERAQYERCKSIPPKKKSIYFSISIGVGLFVRSFNKAEGREGADVAMSSAPIAIGRCSCFLERHKQFMFPVSRLAPLLSSAAPSLPVIARHCIEIRLPRLTCALWASTS